jgi:hypothetical protein
MEETGKPEKFMAKEREGDAREIRPSAIVMQIVLGKAVVVRW